MKDPYLPQILGLLAAGMTSTALAVSGYLHQPETFRFLGTQLTYQAAYRKIPLSLMGTGLCASAWLLTQTRRDYRRQYEEWERQTLLKQGQLQAIAHHAELEGYQQVAQLQAAERLYPQMAPYLSDVQEADYQDVSAPQPQATSQPQSETAAPGQPAMPVTPASAPTADTTAYLQNFLEYPGLLFGGMGAGKSWTARYLVMEKVRAGHQVILLDPHAANHEWKGIRHIGAGMDYRAIAEFLQWYLDEIERRYQEFNRSGLTEEDWQQSLRQQQRITSVVSEEMTNWADRLPGDIGSKFFKSAMSDSRKVLMPPLFVAHDRTLSALGDAKGIARLRDAALLELELIPTIHPTTRKPISSGKGKLKLPGHAEWLAVELPQIERKITDFTLWSSPQSQTFQPLTPPQAPPLDFRTQVNSWLQDCWQADASQLEPKETPSQVEAMPAGNLKSLALYLRKKGSIAVRDVRQNWGRNQGLNGEQVQALLLELIALHLIETFSPLNSKAEWVRWSET
ncbi:MAG: ATP-binding protein [Stenomitos rutilans HA7619-LM2]|nr:ATP-binding protein [Stenomitos rutilans HA7619-LM2]